MKLADFVEMIDFKTINEQGIYVIVKVDFNDNCNYLNNELVGKAMFVCNELTIDDPDIYENIGINPETTKDFVGFDRVDLSEDNNGIKSFQSVNGDYYVVLN